MEIARECIEIAKQKIDDWIKLNDVTKILNLNYLGLNDDDFNELILPYNLQKLYCYRNNLTKLKLNIFNLQILHCASNSLIELDLNTPNLIILNCSSNNLKELKLDTPNLQLLICSLNNLTELKLNAPNLTLLNCDNNNLLELDLNTHNLHDLNCNYNRYLYLPLKYRNKFNKKDYHKNYNSKAHIIQQIYRKYKTRILVKYLNSIHFLYDDINHIISSYSFFIM